MMASENPDPPSSLLMTDTDDEKNWEHPSPSFPLASATSLQSALRKFRVVDVNSELLS